MSMVAVCRAWWWAGVWAALALALQECIPSAVVIPILRCSFVSGIRTLVRAVEQKMFKDVMAAKQAREAEE